MRWERSVSGPDWQDCLSTIRALEEIHECTIVLTLTSAGTDVPGQCALNLMARRTGLAQSTEVEIGVGGVWPCASSRTIEGRLFELLMRLDAAALRSWYPELNAKEGAAPAS